MLIQIARLMKNCDNDGGNEVIAVDRRYGLSGLWYIHRLNYLSSRACQVS